MGEMGGFVDRAYLVSVDDLRHICDTHATSGWLRTTSLVSLSYTPYSAQSATTFSIPDYSFSLFELAHDSGMRGQFLRGCNSDGISELLR
jgi:hypothetical protein